MSSCNDSDEQFKSIRRAEVLQALRWLPRSWLLEDNTMESVFFAPLPLLMTESDPLLFLCRENHNVPMAAFKLALSWSKRASYFGSRAFLPMSRNGLGTLTHEDVAALDHSCMQQLPHDVHGHGVFMITASKIESCLNSHGSRALFYQLHSAQKTGGIVFLFLASDAPCLERLNLFFRLLSDVVNQALPLKVMQVHMLFSPHLTEPSRMLETLVLKLIVQQTLSSQVHVMQVTSPLEIADTLVGSFGMTKQGLPAILGGTLGPAMHAQVSEIGMQSVPSRTIPFLEPHGLAIDHRQVNLAAARLDAAIEGAPCIEANGNTLPNALASKRKAPSAGQVHDQDSNKKMKASLPTTESGMASIQGQEQSDDMQDDNETYRPPNTNSLEQDSDKKMSAKRAASSNVVVQADEPSGSMQDDRRIARHVTFGQICSDNPAFHPHQQESVAKDQQEAEDDAEKRTKARNALYSRRRYYKKKIEIEVLQDEAHRLQTQKSEFLREQERLEQLYANAQQCIKMHESVGFFAAARPAV